MCLISKTREPKISKEKIIGYKVIRRIKGSKNSYEYSSPVYHYPLYLNCPMKAVNKNETIWMDRYMGEDGYCVRGNGIHILKTLEGAKTYLEECNNYESHKSTQSKKIDFIIVEATIEKDIEYWEGYTNLMVRDYDKFEQTYKKIDSMAARSVILRLIKDGCDN